jgi:hypothetical protein
MGSPPEPQEETMRPGQPRQLVTAALCSLTLMLPACSSGLDSGNTRAGLSCVDDSAECVQQRQTTLKAMLSDQDRRWVKEQATPHAHASGVRLFAYRSKKSELTCEELAHGRREAEAAPKSLRSTQNLSPAQISRATMFAAEVSKELSVEMRKRHCRA